MICVVVSPFRSVIYLRKKGSTSSGHTVNKTHTISHNEIQFSKCQKTKRQFIKQTLIQMFEFLPTWWRLGELCLICLGVLYVFNWLHIACYLFPYYQYRVWYAQNHPVGERVTRRKRWSPSVRSRIETQQLCRCPKCWRMLDGTRDLDHILPLHHLGADAEFNLQVLHATCHAHKTRHVDG
jgi:hypothetical protein